MINQYYDVKKENVDITSKMCFKKIVLGKPTFTNVRRCTITRTYERESKYGSYDNVIIGDYQGESYNITDILF
jgi:uncharacterized protein YktA (UPF0223 family)